MHNQGVEEIDKRDVLLEEELRLIPPGTPLWRKMNSGSPMPYFYMETLEHGHCLFGVRVDGRWEVRGRADGYKTYGSLVAALEQNPPAETPVERT